MIRQNGQETATASAPVAAISRTRPWPMRWAGASSNHIRPPPPPQHAVFVRLRGSSITGSAPNRSPPALAARTARGASTSPSERAEVARVVERDRAPVAVGGVAFRLEPPGTDELLQQLAVVDDLVLAAELRVVVAKTVDAVRAVGHDPPHAVLEERRDVLLGKLSEEQLVAHAASRLRRCSVPRGRARRSSPWPLAAGGPRCGRSSARGDRTPRRSRPSTGFRSRDSLATVGTSRPAAQPRRSLWARPQGCRRGRIFCSAVAGEPAAHLRR